jgi:hypothetical protein
MQEGSGDSRQERGSSAEDEAANEEHAQKKRNSKTDLAEAL